MQSKKKQKNTGITALYCRLSRDDGTEGDSNSIACVALLPHQEITEDEDGAPISEEASAPDGNEPVEAVDAENNEE